MKYFHLLVIFLPLLMSAIVAARRTTAPKTRALRTTSHSKYHGILINSDSGTQLYDPFNAPNAHGGLSLGLQTDLQAMDGAAVANGPLAYFASGFPGTSFIVYDSSSNVTRTLSPMPVSRTAYGMTLLGNDALVCGGSTTQPQSRCDLYNTSSNAWAAAGTIPPLPIAMAYFPMITLHTRPYLFGGMRGSGGSDILNTVYTFDTSNAWATRAPMERALYMHAAVALDTNTALVCGGIGWGALSACSSYAATEDVWSPAAQMITARMNHGMAVYKGRVFVYGGNGDSPNSQLSSVEMLSIDRQSWESLPTPMFAAASHFVSAPLP